MIEEKKMACTGGRQMKDITGMSVEQHHLLCLGIMARCYQHVPQSLKQAIIEGAQAAKEMGAEIDPDNLQRNLPLSMNQ